MGRIYKHKINNYMCKIKDEIIKEQEEGEVNIDLAYAEYEYLQGKEEE
jgi:hypothetical protein